MQSVQKLCIHIQSIRKSPPHHSEYILIFLHTLSVWQPQPREFTSYPHDMAASTSWVTSYPLDMAASNTGVYIIFIQYGSLKTLSYITFAWCGSLTLVSYFQINQNLNYPKTFLAKIEKIFLKNPGIPYGRNISLKRKD